MQHSSGFLELVNEAKTRVREIGVDEVRAKQQRGDQFTFVDVREDSEWAQGHCAGAMHLGKGLIERDIEGRVPGKDTELVLYCGGGYRSALAADAIQRMGYRSVLSMAGGIKAWRDRGLPIEG
jgi:rhodanese-related sulfurtransferase